MRGEEAWVGLVKLRRRGSRRSGGHGPATAYATIVARARTRFSFRREAAEHAKSRGWQLEHVLVAEPLEQFLEGPRGDQNVDERPADPGEDAKEAADLRSLAAAVLADGVARSHDWDEVRASEATQPSWNERMSNVVWQLLWWVGVPIFIAFTLPFLVQDIGPAYRAEFGHGTPGVFTATSRECDKTCSSTGNWAADDGSRVLHHVTLGTGAGAPYPGQTRRAIDAGDRGAVYPAAGNWDWLIITVLLCSFAGLSAVWLHLLARRIRER